IGTVDSHAVDDFTSVLGNDVEQIEHDGGVGTMRLHLQLVARVHVHDRRPYLRTTLRTHRGKEGPDILAPTAPPDPQHALASRLDDDRGIPMTLLDRELIHRDHRYTLQIHRPERSLEAAAIDLLDRLPVQ